MSALCKVRREAERRNAVFFLASSFRCGTEAGAGGGRCVTKSYGERLVTHRTVLLLFLLSRLVYRLTTARGSSLMRANTSHDDARSPVATH